MKLFYMQWRKQAGRKFLVVFLAVLLLSFSISAYLSKQYAKHLSDVIELQAQAADMNFSNMQTQADISDGDIKEYYQKAAASLQNLKTAYQNQNSSAIINATKEYAEVIVSGKQYGISFTSNLLEAKDTAELCSILQKNAIAVYHEPSLRYEGYHDGSAAVTYFLKNYIFFLLPVIVMLLCADSFSSEMQSGSMKLLLSFPCSRFSIFQAKYCSGVILSLTVLLAGLVGTFIGGTLFSGTGDPRYPIKAQASFWSVERAEVYIPEWQIWLRAGAVLFCAILFFTALALLISIIFKSSVFSLIFGSVLTMGGTLANRQWVLTGKQKVTFPRFLPFDMADGYSAAVGKIEYTLSEFGTDTSGLISMGNTSAERIIANTFPGALACGILLLSAAVCYCLTILILRKRDVA